ncbi:MAG: serine/threonine protein kinase [Planctomycetales bacterium]|nr:serine/threonine protein kinase [Planctomycetales bacterium]
MTKIRDFLGPYRLARLIRLGSSCQVWEAIQSDTGERFALKVLREDFRQNRQEVSFLKTEFEIAKSMNHPNIIKMYDLVLDGSAPFLVLELFSELNMKQALRRGPESIAYMLDKIIEQSTEGLYHMHSQGYVHCDIKPDNFLVSREGDVKVIDFTISQKIKKGIARLLGRKTKNIQGTRSYMAPEQIRGLQLDARSDIYSFGCVLFELVTGKLPYTGESPNDLLNKHISAPIPSPLVANDNVTPEFTALIRGMMAKKPEDRPESMWELLKTLRVTKIFKKQPRIPETSIFDDFPTSGRVAAQEKAEPGPG